MNSAMRTPCRHFRCSVIALLLLLLAAVSLDATAACAGKLAALQSYAGKYRSNADLLDAPALTNALSRLPGTAVMELKRNLDVSGPTELSGCHLIVSGNAPHMGGEQDAMLDVDLVYGTAIAAIHAGGRIDIYVLADPPATPRWNALPRALREWAVRADMGSPQGFGQQQAVSLAMPASVHLHAPSVTAAQPSRAPAPGKTLAIDFDKHAVKPTPAQAAAIKRTAGDLQAMPGHAGEPLYALVLADLNDDGRADLVVQFTYASGNCGSAGCSGSIVMATPSGYARKAIDLPNFTTLAVLPTTHGGMHDLQFDGDSPVWQWTGSEYEIPKADRPQSHAPAWETRAAAGRTLALVVPIDSVIKTVSVFCDQGKPVLAMLLKTPRAPAATTLTWVFRGWTVNVAMSPASRNGTLWMADLSRSDLPMWLAHRGNNAQAQELARLATESYLRINGEMQGQVSLKDSTAATRAALTRCYRY